MKKLLDLKGHSIIGQNQRSLRGYPARPLRETNLAPTGPGKTCFYV